MLTTYDNLHNFFHNSVNSALQNQRVSANDHTKIYLVNLLSTFARTENLFENIDNGLGLRPLTEYYKDAIYTRSKSQQFKCLQRLGDVALFITGVFSESISNKNIDIDFYIAMGENAYSYLSDLNSQQPCIKAHQEAFSELAGNFITFVDIISEINEQACSISHSDLLKQYDLWLKTGSTRAAKILRKFGIKIDNLPCPNRKH